MSEDGAGRPALGPMDVRKVMAALPHRYPMLLIDRVERLEPDVRIVATKAAFSTDMRMECGRLGMMSG